MSAPTGNAYPDPIQPHLRLTLAPFSLRRLALPSRNRVFLPCLLYKTPVLDYRGGGSNYPNATGVPTPTNLQRMPITGKQRFHGGRAFAPACAPRSPNLPQYVIFFQSFPQKPNLFYPTPQSSKSPTNSSSISSLTFLQPHNTPTTLHASAPSMGW